MHHGMPEHCEGGGVRVVERERGRRWEEVGKEVEKVKRKEREKEKEREKRRIVH